MRVLLAAHDFPAGHLGFPDCSPRLGCRERIAEYLRMQWRIQQRLAPSPRGGSERDGVARSTGVESGAGRGSFPDLGPCGLRGRNSCVNRGAAKD
jgi:hypothetical protein